MPTHSRGSSPSKRSSSPPPTLGNRRSSAGSRASWAPDNMASHCYDCAAPFTFFRRKHHCRECGNIFCDGCTKGRVHLAHEKEPVRVCNTCSYVNVLKQEEPMAPPVNASFGSGHSPSPDRVARRASTGVTMVPRKSSSTLASSTSSSSPDRPRPTTLPVRISSSSALNSAVSQPPPTSATTTTSSCNETSERTQHKEGSAGDVRVDEEETTTTTKPISRAERETIPATGLTLGSTSTTTNVSSSFSSSENTVGDSSSSGDHELAEQKEGCEGVKGAEAPQRGCETTDEDSGGTTSSATTSSTSGRTSPLKLGPGMLKTMKKVTGLLSVPSFRKTTAEEERAASMPIPTSMWSYPPPTPAATSATSKTTTSVGSSSEEMSNSNPLSTAENKNCSEGEKPSPSCAETADGWDVVRAEVRKPTKLLCPYTTRHRTAAVITNGVNSDSDDDP